MANANVWGLPLLMILGAMLAQFGGTLSEDSDVANHNSTDSRHHHRNPVEDDDDYSYIEQYEKYNDTDTQSPSRTNETADYYGPPLPFDLSADGYRDVEIQEPRFTFTPTIEEAQAKRMEIRYNAIDDSYYRPPQAGNDSVESPRTSSWKSGLWRYYNIERKVELDHDFSYLARVNTYLDNQFSAFLEYRIDLRPTGLIVKNLQIRLPFHTYRDGSIAVWVSAASNYTTPVIPPESEALHPVPAAQGWDDFVIRVVLSGVRGDEGTRNAYQNAQLFREKTDRPSDGVWNDPFHVVVDLA